MTFGEKLLQLRKGRGLSQEALAEQLHTTRQAVSKWENNQGYPETEKLLMLSSIFGVSIDSLLKENTEQSVSTENGYYVSRECAEEFLLFHRKTTERTAAGVAIMISAGVPYVLFAGSQILSAVLACIVLVIGFSFILNMAMMGNPYKRLKSERLSFDPAYFSQLSFAREAQKKKSFGLIICGIALVLGGGILDLVKMPPSLIFAMQCALAACSAYLFISAIGIMDTYDILVQSEERMDSTYWRLIKKIKDSFPA